MPNILKSLTVLLIFISTVFASHGNEKKFTVVIDPGHGGKDIGAADNSAFEKNINLEVALQLGELLKKKAKDIQVVFTRDDDTFISLQGRADKANKSKGDIFVSIHTNSVDMSNKNRTNICGASTYVLGTHKDNDNQQVARRENAVMVLENDYQTTYQGFDPNSDESNIIFEIAQKGNMQNSIRLANEVQKNLADVAGRKNRGVHQAGFWVLWATSMPSILVELDFICNPESAQYLTSSAGQKKLAEAIYKGIIRYKSLLRNTKANEEKDLNEDYSSADAVIETTQSCRQVTEAIKRPSTNERPVAQVRRRRSDKARKESAEREIEVAVIETPQVSKPQLFNKQKELPELLAADKSSLISDNKSDVQPKKNKNGKIDLGQSKPAKRQAGVHARLDKKNIIYKIELFSSKEDLKTNNSKFFGLSPISCVKQGEVYRYLYGESSDQHEISKILETVQQNIPEAKIVRVRKSIN